ncbi:MAG: SDR family oxidoreductase [Pseudomonadota bacterium]
MDLDLKGKNAIIAGASKGIGLRIARGLAAEGVNLAIGARGQDDLDKAVAELSEHGVDVHGATVDVGDGPAYVKWLEGMAGKLGGVDMFVPVVSAGGGQGDEAWEKALQVDMLGVSRGIETLMPHLEKTGGSAVAISSTNAVEQFPVIQPYNSMKAAIINYISTKSQETFAKGVRLNTVTPGSIFFEGGSWDMAKQHHPDFYKMIEGGIPAGRLGKPEEVADVVIFLLSPRASWVNGTNVVVDGGQTKRVQF